MRVLHENNGLDVRIQYWMDRPPLQEGGPQVGPTTPARLGQLRIPIARGMNEAYYLPKDIAQMAGMTDFSPSPTNLILFPARNPNAKTNKIPYKELMLGA